MKKYFFLSAAALAALLGGSCANELDAPTSNGNVTIKVRLPEKMNTRAFGDGAQSVNLDYSIFSGDKFITSGSKNDAFVNNVATFEVPLATGENYTFVFWASGENSVYTYSPESASIAINTKIEANNEALDAFCSTTTVENVGENSEINATLTRPFAQLNLGTSENFKSPIFTEAYPDVNSQTSTTLTVKNVPTTLNLLKATATNPQTITFTTSSIPADESFEVNNTSYAYISMAYLPLPEFSANSSQSTVDVNYVINYNGNPIKTVDISNVPVQVNFRTNLYGDIFTNNTPVNIDIQPGFNDTDFNKDFNVTKLTTPAEIAAAAVVGGNYAITAPIDNLDLSDLNPKAPLNILISSPVSTLTLSSASASVESTTITVAKDVAFPEFKFKRGTTDNPTTLANFTLKGDVNSSQKCSGLNFSGVNMNLNNFTVDGVPFTGMGVYLFYDGGTAACVDLTGITVKNCNFENLTTPGVTVRSHDASKNIGDINIINNTFSYVESNSTNGLMIQNATYGTVNIEGNTILNAPYHGMYIEDASVPVTITNNKCLNCANDGIKVQSTNTTTITNNTVSQKENGIRLKTVSADNTYIVTGNTINMTEHIEFNNGEPYGILFVGKSADPKPSPTIIVKDNIKVGVYDHWFEFVNITPAAGSEYSNPFTTE